MKYFLGAVMTALFGATSASAATISMGNLPALANQLVGYKYPHVDPAPEPATWGLMIIGFVLLALASRARRKVKA